MIQKDEIYNLRDIHKNKLIPSVLNFQTLRKLVSKGKLIASKKGKGGGTRYEVKGQDIIDYNILLNAKILHEAGKIIKQ